MELIDRDIFVKQLEDYIEHAESFDFQMAVIGVVNDLKKQPTVDAEPVRHARLINPSPYGECSCCGELIDSRDRFRYCPYCGARLVGEGDKHGAD